MKKLTVFLLLLAQLQTREIKAQPKPETNLPATTSFSISDEDFMLNGKPFVIRCGEMHFARIPQEYWRHRLKMAKAMGLNTVCAYLFWNLHEPAPGQFK